ncbi:Uncharacterised protein [Vibrio cholerae]|nr:Uncharacterised protein [Vibrio cholerae]
MPQLTNAAIIHGLLFSSLRCAYQAKVINTLLQISRPTLTTIGFIFTLSSLDNRPKLRRR